MKPTRRRVWVVDDSQVERERVAKILEPDYAVETFADGALVLERFARDRPPEALVLDWVMGDIGGQEVIEFARAHPETDEMAVVVVTGNLGGDGVVRALHAGADDFLRKPADEAELLARLGRLLERQLKQDRVRRRTARSARRRVLAAQAEVDLERSRSDAAAEEARMAELFMGILGHDLRAPLSAILWATRALEEDVPAERRRAALERVRASAGRMNQMIGQLLDLTRSRLGGGIVIDSMPLEIGTVVEDVLAEQRDANPGRDLHLAVRDRASVLGDKLRLAQLLSNLVGNALQHGARSAPVSVRVARVADEVTVAVQNGGAPIAVADLQTLFDPFRRVAAGPTRGGESLGLGLYISQHLAMAHGGALDVRSDSDGTVFTLRLPCAPA